MEALQALLAEYVLKLIILLLIVLVSLGIKFLNKVIAGTPYEKAAKKIMELVLKAEIKFPESGVGEELRKPWVLEEAAKFCKKHKIPLNVVQINKILEDTVDLINILRTQKN